MVRAGRIVSSSVVSWALVPVVLLLLGVAPATGQVLEAELVASDGATSDTFGRAVALDADRAVVGASGDASSTGAAYVFERVAGAFVEQAKLTASDGTDGDALGTAVGLSGDVAVAGAPDPVDPFGAASGAGRAYVFRSDGGGAWPQEAILVPADGQPFDAFGSAVAADGDLIVVGAPGDEPSGLGTRNGGTGAAYVFAFDGGGWVQEAKLVAAGGALGDTFGASVAIRGGFIVVGAPGADAGGQDAGALHVFRLQGQSWMLDAVLLATGAAAGDRLGAAVALDVDLCAGGAPGRAGERGAALVYRRSGGTWSQEDELSAAAGLAGDALGSGLGLAADRLVAGAPGAGGGDGAGVLFEDDGTGWDEAATLALPGSTFLGYAAASDGTTALLGAPLSDGGGQLFAGAAVVFGLGPQTDCNGNGVEDATDIASGTSADCNGNGIPDECEPDCNGNGVPDDCDLVAGTSEDCNGNGVPDECDIAAGTSSDCNGNGLPDECETDCNGNGLPDDCDLGAGTSEDCNGNGVPDECDIAAGTSDDCNGNGVPDECEPDCNGNGVPDDCDVAAGTSADCNGNGLPDECDIASGTSLDCNGNGVPDECEIDCNGNDVPDDCDVALGTSLDCNGNGIPDECDIASGRSLDCNGNTIPDECDIAAGTSEDCNANGVLDECDIASGTSEDLDDNGVPDECQGSFTDLRNGLAGVAGVPVLAGSGTLIGGDPFGLALSSAAPLSVATLFVGVSRIDAPFKGGVLVPAPDLLVSGLPTDVGGGLVLGATWPPGVPGGVILYYQFWIVDPAGPKNLSASNGLSSTTP